MVAVARASGPLALCCAALMATGCGSSENDDSGSGGASGSGGSAGSSGGSAGSSGGSAGSSGGSAGSSGGSAGSSGGSAGLPPVPDSGPPPAACLGKPLPARALDPVAGPAPASLAPYFPTTAFRTATAAEAGLDAAKLDAALAFAPEHSNTQGILVLRHGYVVGERYVGSFTATSRHESYSVAKGFTSALVGIAIGKGLLSGVDEPICKHYPAWGCGAGDPRSKITVAHAMNVTTGLQWNEDWRVGKTGANDAYSPNILDVVLSRPVVDEPGTKQRYSTGDPALLSVVLQSVTGKTVLEYAREVLFAPLGLSEITWSSDSKGRTNSYAGIRATVREFSKFGFLYLRRGKWDGQEIVPESWVDFTTRAADPCHDQYRYLWHLNLPLRLGDQDPQCAGFLQCDPVGFANLPANGFYAIGVAGQLIIVLPSADIVIARVAQDDLGGEYWDGYARDLTGMVLDAVVK
jgi:CubicO group peptidase (beta-lactamase class C family)